MTENSPPAIEIRELQKRYSGVLAVRGISFSLARGEVLGLLGGNGAGKTTLFNSICGLAPVSHGALTLNDLSVEWPKPHQLADLNIARTLQGVGLFPDLSVMENVKIGAHKFAKSSLLRSILALDKKEEKALPAHGSSKALLEHLIEAGKKDFTVTRYKGLGEMTAEQLWETTMNADSRSLLQVRLDDALEAETIFSTLMGEDVEVRRKFIEDNALDVKNLDV